jgi:hypothetical protein
MDRTELLEKIFASRSRLEETLAQFDAEQMVEPGLPGGWSVKDLFAHLGWWEFRAVDIYGTLVKGTTPRVVIHPDEMDRVNNRVIEEFRSRPLEEMQLYERQAFENLVKIAEMAPDLDLFNRHRFAWTQGEPFVSWIMRNTYEHYDEHIALLEHRIAVREGSLAGPVVVTGAYGPVVKKAGDFLHKTGRDVDKALYDFHFSNSTLDDLMTALKRYQNEDGGFFGLDVDIKAPQSNPFATELALVAMRWSKTPRDHPVLQRAVEYLETTQREDGTWRFTPEIYQSELAPWYQNWHWPNINPSCSIAGVLRQLGVGSHDLHARVQALFDRLATPGDLTGNEYYDVRPYAYYLQDQIELPVGELYRWGVAWWIVRQHLTNPQIDSAHLLDFTPMPSSSIAARLPAAVLQARLDALLAEQAEDGGWPTSYDPLWRGWVTITNLLVLRAHGRV